PKLHHVGHGYLSGLDRTHVYFDAEEDGTLWAAADSYKARFDRAGATYVPFFGSRASRSFPVRMALRSIHVGGESVLFDADVAASREGNRVVFHRGSVDEV